METLQRRVISEDTVQYKLFLVQTDDPSSQQTEEHLTQLAEQILANVAPLLIQFIWQNQPFNLRYHSEKGGVPAHIGGSTQFGDNVEDEWFIVYLLQQITENFPQLAARVEDNDGEFLLIEAADYLPKWLNPDTSENRVFFYQGELHILPCPSKSSPLGIAKDVVPSVAQALSLLYTQPDACRASPKITAAVKKRLEGYPEKIGTNLHRAHCFVPAGVAQVLTLRPDLVAPAVSAFYLRDPVDLQACRSFRTFPPDTRVLTSVTFTRCLYAQLQQQHFSPDRRSGFSLPPSSHPQYKAHELGMKLAHGFEILCSKCRLPSSEPDAPVSCNPQWKGFLGSLKSNGYFREELEGSARWRELMRSAENFFRQSVASSSCVLSPGQEVLQTLRSCSAPSVEELKTQESQLPQEDSDSWLNITAQDLEQMLQERSSGQVHVSGQNSSQQMRSQVRRVSDEKEEEKEDEQEKDSSYSLVAVSQGMKNFLSAMSSHEGAELPWSSSCRPFSLEPDVMAGALDKLLGGEEKEEEEEELDSDDLDEDEEDDEEEEGENEEEESSGHDEMNGAESLDSLRRYMDQMDQELMDTNVGKSFSNHNKAASVHAPGSDALPGEGGEEEEIQPLDVDLNLISNLLESLSCQEGLAGPASNLLQSLGLHLPPNSDGQQ